MSEDDPPMPPLPSPPEGFDDAYRWQLCVFGAMKALNLDDPREAVFFASVLYRSDMPTRDPAPADDGPAG